VIYIAIDSGLTSAIAANDDNAPGAATAALLD